jgi:hypothetical protein
LLSLLFSRDHVHDRARKQGKLLRAVYTRVFCVRFSVCDGAAAQHLPLLFHVCDRARKAKEAVGRRRHCGRDNGREKRQWNRPFTISVEKLAPFCKPVPGARRKHCNYTVYCKVKKINFCTEGVPAS